MAAQGPPLVEELERQIDEILDRRMHRGPRRRLALTEENVRRLFGLGLEDLFRRLAAKFGYEIEDETSPPK